MGKLRILSGAEACRILAAHGFAKVRQRGSHIVMQRKVSNSTVTVVVPNHRELKQGTLRSIVRQSLLPISLFEND